MSMETGRNEKSVLTFEMLFFLAVSMSGDNE